MFKVLIIITSLFKFKILDNGDDCNVIMERGSYRRVKDLISPWFLNKGYTLKIENVAYDWTKIIFCQSRIVWNGAFYTMVRDWRKVLSQSTCGTRHWNDPFMVRPMCGLLGDCELALSAGVPILQSYALALRRISAGKRAKLSALDPGVAYRVGLEGDVDELIRSAKSRNVTPLARDTFATVFGVTPWEQLAIESILDKWDLDSTDARTVPAEWDYRWEDCRSLSVALPELY